MRKYFCVFLCLTIAFIFTACNTNNSAIDCYNCSKKISAEDVYCKYCGAQVVNNANKKIKACASVLITTGSSTDTAITSKDIQNSISIAYKYAEIMKSDKSLQKIQEKLDFPISKSELKEAIHFNLKSEDSCIINITVFTNTQENANKILSCLLKESPSIINSIFTNANFSILSTTQ